MTMTPLLRSMKIGAVHPADYAALRTPAPPRKDLALPPPRPYLVTGPTRPSRTITGRTIGAPVLDLSGRRYGALTVLEVWGRHYKGVIYFTCRCDCGTVFITQRQALTSGRTRACRWPGCPHTVHRTRPALPPLTSTSPRTPATPRNPTRTLTRSLTPPRARARTSSALPSRPSRPSHPRSASVALLKRLRTPRGRPRPKRGPTAEADAGGFQKGEPEKWGTFIHPVKRL